MLTSVAKKRLLKLATFLEGLNPKNFNLEHFTDTDDLNGVVKLQKGKQKPKHKCGTTACAIGWTPAVFPHLIKWGEFGTVMQRGLNGKCNFAIAELLFDFPPAESNYTIIPEFSYLFMPERYPKYQRGPKYVARRIRKYVENGGTLPATLPYYPG